MRKFYILENFTNDNHPGVYKDIKTAQSVKKKMEKTYGKVYVILEVETLKVVEE